MNHHIADPYAVLGVPRGASTDEVHAAYRRLAKHYHPDRNRGLRAAEEMRRINHAWEIVSSPTGRKRFTPAGNAPGPARPAGAPPPSAWAADPAQRPWTAPDRYPDRTPPSRMGQLPWIPLVLAIPIVAFGLVGVLGGIFPLLLVAFLVIILGGSALGESATKEARR